MPAILFGPFYLLPSQRLAPKANQPRRLGSRAFDLKRCAASHVGSTGGRQPLHRQRGLSGLLVVTPVIAPVSDPTMLRLATLRSQIVVGISAPTALAVHPERITNLGRMARTFPATVSQIDAQKSGRLKPAS
jgi:hypothetical protein